MPDTTTPRTTAGSSVAPAAARPVGVDIQESETNRAVVEAIEADNPDCAVAHPAWSGSPPRSPRRQPGHRRGPPRARVGDPRVPDGDRVLLRPHPGLG